MPNLGELDIDLLRRVWAGTASADEAAAVESWLDGAPNRRAWYRQLRHGVQGGLSPALAAAEIERRTSNVLFKIQSLPAGAPGRSRFAPVARFASRRWSSTAALAIGIGVCCVVVFALVTGRLTPGAAPTVRSYATVAGQQATVTLANGSRVVLGPLTSISVTSDGSGAGIVVRIVGQALFTVAHRANAPFTVRSGHSMTRVLGTTFLVREYPTDRNAHIAVVDGRVLLQGIQESLVAGAAVLSANTLGAVDDSGRVIVTPNIVASDYTAWTTGQLVFHKTPAREIAAELSRAYGVEIHLADSTLATQTLTWTVSVGRKSFSSIVDALATALEAHVTRSAGVITIVSGPAGQSKPGRSRLISPPESQYGR